MKLVLYSGGFDHENKRLDEVLFKLCDKKKPKITFIPSSSHDAEADYAYFVNQYRKFKVGKILYFPIDTTISEILKSEILKSDIIHLSGGNTFYFLKYLRKSKLLSDLKQFVKNGGILTGLSAGAILMTPTIEMAEVPYFDRDDNDEGVTNYKALELVDFHFFPHYKNSKRYDDELKKFSTSKRVPLYAAKDGSGIVVDNDSLKFIGKIYCFYKGHKFLV